MEQKEDGLPAAAVPLPGLDPRIALASTLQTSATTALLLGSGVSRSAGVPTGWEMTVDLIRRYMRACGVEDSDILSPEMWWEKETGTSARYDHVVPAMAPTDAARRDLLCSYFERDQNGFAFKPTPAHTAVAELAAKGRIPVILTTNFDRLMEHALQAAGVDAQILIHPNAVRGMTPLQHAGVTLVKLHGDYAGGPLLNDPQELSRYAPGWRRLLSRVFDEYGLVVVGWSGDQDRALAGAMAQAVGRRYAWYWAARHGRLGDEGRRLVNGHGAHVIKIEDADEFLFGILGTFDAISRQRVRREAARPTIPLRAPTVGISPPGWDQVPLVHIRTVVAFAPVTDAEAGRITPRVRRMLVKVLDESSLGQFVNALNAERRPAVTSSEGQIGREIVADEVATRWRPSQDGHQTTGHASYQLGAKGGPATSALLQVFAPAAASTNQVVLTLDIGCSFVDGVEPSLLVEILHRSIRMLGSDLTPVIAEIAPPTAGLERVEIHWGSPMMQNSTNRPVPAANQVHLGVLGTSDRAAPQMAGYAEFPPGDQFDRSAISALVLRAVETIALDGGYLDPEPGLESLRAHLSALDPDSSHRPVTRAISTPGRQSDEQSQPQ